MDKQKNLDNSEIPDETNSFETMSTAEKLAFKNGYENWKDVSEINFTFNVDRGEQHFERAWTWNTRENSVKMVSKDTVTYNRSEMDSLKMKTDSNFINDQFWLLAPYNLMWDKGISFSENDKAKAPISGDTLQKLTAVYNNDGGYTPGDAYDFYYDTDYKIKEWTYRQANAEKPSMSTTWEDYEDFGDLSIAKMHKDSTGNFKLYFTNISVSK